eukprot:CAMPEP_0170527526 /NCGR_PEP_ID=MMETSP0209-20121228/12991_1 /TAXON_ID=665100 ORGANISM="Litonotus pictus, Strain P1" /NCGR_SAMPLE_ID=MMETSP0209 /ASSEMBLY_ACC=CAM_ASM_000301 /LENGTH=405 /DNA_ID=CAMNT_0010818109 /DNA_START=11 /DNA_END=1226 /DNA_ORIENTATION=-
MSNFTYLLNLEKSIDPFIQNKINRYEEKKQKKLAKEPIDKAIFQENLQDLGITFNGYNHAYLSINISNKDLISIGGISEFRFLQNINLSNNKLTVLEPLSGLKHINFLDASHNSISETFDFDPSSKLEVANYSFNLIREIMNVGKNRYLRILNLSNNNIQRIENLSDNYFLEELNLSFNSIEVIENLDGLNIQRLNLMCNKIRMITGLDNLKSLLELNLSKNQLTRLKGLQNLPNLRYLYLSSNSISRAKQIAYIIEIPYLTDLDLCHNDVQNRKFYRLNLLSYLPQLRCLDGQNVTYTEKVKADCIMGDDLEKKKEIFCGYLPEEDWVDRRLFVKEQIDPESDSDEEADNIDKDNKKSKAKLNDKLMNSKNVTLSTINDKRAFGDEMYETAMEDRVKNLPTIEI